MAAEVDADYEGRDVLLVGVLKGAVMVMADLARAMSIHLQMDWMAVSSYGSSTKSSGVVRILKDLDTDITGRHVLIVEDIIDSGLTLSWLMRNLTARGCRIGRGLTMLRKPEAVKVELEPQVHRVRHPQRVRRRVRPGLRGEVPQPARDRDAGPARLQLRSRAASRLARPSPVHPDGLIRAVGFTRASDGSPVFAHTP